MNIKNIFLNLIQIDHIVEQGTSGIWTYEKWASGKAKCWGKYSWTSVSVTNTWGTMYSASLSPGTVAFPSGLFIEAPLCLYCADSEGSNYWFATNYGTSSIVTKDHTQRIQPIRPTSVEGITVVASFEAIGRWK